MGTSTYASSPIPRPGSTRPGGSRHSRSRRRAELYSRGVPLERVGLILFTLDESTYSRELAPPLRARDDLGGRRTCGWLGRKLDAGARGGGGTPTLAQARVRPGPAPQALDAAERGEAAVDRHDDAGDEGRGRTAKPDHGAGKLVRFAEAAGRGARDDPRATCRQRS